MTKTIQELKENKMKKKRKNKKQVKKIEIKKRKTLTLEGERSQKQHEKNVKPG